MWLSPPRPAVGSRFASRARILPVKDHKKASIVSFVRSGGDSGLILVCGGLLRLLRQNNFWAAGGASRFAFRFRPPPGRRGPAYTRVPRPTQGEGRSTGGRRGPAYTRLPRPTQGEGRSTRYTYCIQVQATNSLRVSRCGPCPMRCASKETAPGGRRGTDPREPRPPGR